MWKTSDGFTLLEVMIALAVVATALMMTGSLRNRDILYHDEARRIIQATLLAQDRVTDMETEDQFPDLGVTSDHFDQPNEEYEWMQTVTPTLFDVAREVHVKVSWGSKANESVELTTYVLSIK
jgi:general secretion pathway protein I